MTVFTTYAFANPPLKNKQRRKVHYFAVTEHRVGERYGYVLCGPKRGYTWIPTRVTCKTCKRILKGRR